MILVENYNEVGPPSAAAGEEVPKNKKKMLIHRNASINHYFNALNTKSTTRNESPKKEDSLQL